MSKANRAGSVRGATDPVFNQIRIVDGAKDTSPARALSTINVNQNIPLSQAFCLACTHRRCAILLPVRQFSGHGIVRVAICRRCWGTIARYGDNGRRGV